MAISKEEAQDIISEFNKNYPVSPYLQFKLRDTMAELYGEEKTKGLYLKAGYLPYQAPADGYTGRIDVVLDHVDGTKDLIESLNHEILGHYGLNTFTPQEKKLFLNNIINHKEELKPLWDYVERNYPNEPLYIQAEEVFCYMAEKVSPEQHIGKNVKQVGEDNFRLINYFNLKPLSEENLKSIVLLVADGISDRSRVQQTFPHNDLTFRQNQEIDISPTPTEPELER